MGMIYVIKNNKGGVGKSFLTSQIASGMAIFDKKVLILTSDSQNNIVDFFKGLSIPDFKSGLKSWVTTGDGDIMKLRENIDFIPLEDNSLGHSFYNKLPEFIEKMKKVYDYILIDSVPVLKIDEEFLKLADKFIIPTFSDKITTHMLLKFLDEIDIEKVHSIIINQFSKTSNQMYWKKTLEKETLNKIDLYTINFSSNIEKLINKGKTIFETGNKELDETQHSILELINTL